MSDLHESWENEPQFHFLLGMCFQEHRVLGIFRSLWHMAHRVTGWVQMCLFIPMSSLHWNASSLTRIPPRPLSVQGKEPFLIYMGSFWDRGLARSGMMFPSFVFCFRVFVCLFLPYAIIMCLWWWQSQGNPYSLPISCCPQPEAWAQFWSEPLRLSKQASPSSPPSIASSVEGFPSWGFFILETSGDLPAQLAGSWLVSPTVVGPPAPLPMPRMLCQMSGRVRWKGTWKDRTWNKVLIERLLHPPCFFKASSQIALSASKKRNAHRSSWAFCAHLLITTLAAVMELCGFLVGQYFMENQ